MANLKQLKCPSCGATLKQSFPDQLIVECPYCQQQVVNTDAYKTANVGKGEEPRILEFKLEVKDVINLLINDLVNDQNVPTDIFDKMRISSTKQYYVPMYIFEGTYRAPWSAQIPREVKKQRINYYGKLENYYETFYDYPSGEVAGDFIINCFSHKESTHLNLINPDISLSPTFLPAFSQVNIGKDIILIAPSGDADYVWRECGYDIIQNRAVSEAEYQAQGYLTNCSSSCEMKKSWMVYIPIWIIEYKYNDESYTYINYAERVDSGSRPYDNKIKTTNITNIYAQPTTEQQETIDNYNKRNSMLSNIRNLGCAGIICVGLIGCYYFEKKLYELSYNNTPGWSDHKNDGNDFWWTCIWVGIAFIIVMSFVKFLFRQKDGIDDIEEDVANRTRLLQKEAEDKMNKMLCEAKKYKRETGNAFLNAFSGVNESNNSGTLYQLNELTQPNLKICIKCGREIDILHMFCRYCGAKQN